MAENRVRSARSSLDGKSGQKDAAMAWLALDESLGEPANMDSLLGTQKYREQMEDHEEFWLVDDGYGYDYVMVFPTDEDKVGEMTVYAQNTIRHMIGAGLQVRVFFSAQKDEIYCEIRAPLERLEQFADQVDRKILLNETVLRERAEAGDPENGVGPISINDDPTISERSPFEFIYGKYDQDPALKSLYNCPDHYDHPFGTTLRMSLISDILRAPKRSGGAGINVNRMLLDKDILGFFPKHIDVDKSEIRRKWLRLCQSPWKQPFHAIRDYFGEKVALYFQFIGHLTKWLQPLALLGLITQIVVYSSGNNEHPITLLFAPVVVIWAIVMLEFWKRKEQKVALEWGMVSFEEEEQDRAEFKGEVIKSPIDGKEMLYFPPSERNARVRWASAVILFLIICVIACIASIYALKWYLVYELDAPWGAKYGATIAAIANAIQIQVLNFVYRGIAVKLVEYENHRTETKFEDSLIVKLFAFQFINSFGSFFYPLIGIKCETDCMTLLSHNLMIVFITQLVVGNITELLIPYLQYKKKRHDETKGADRADLTHAEEEYMLVAYDPIYGTLMDYAELAIQFGYLTLFVVSFPLAPFLALITNAVEIKSDAYKLLTKMQRPVPRGAEDIGRWQHIFTFICMAAVVTNAASMCFVYETQLGKLSLPTKLWCFIFFTYGTYLAMSVLEAAVPDVPHDVAMQIKRQDFLTSKIIDKVADELDDDFEVATNESLERIIIDVKDAPLTPKSEPNSPWAAPRTSSSAVAKGNDA